MVDYELCRVFWGSHGCNKESGHVEKGDIVHVCTECAECIVLGPEARSIGDVNAAVRYMTWDGDEDAQPWSDEGWTFAGWSDWVPSHWFTV